MLFTRNVVLFVCVLPALVIGLQVFLSMQENKWLGLLLPMLCALLSLTALRGIVVLPGESLWQVLPTVVLTVLYGQTRILVSMSRDGLVPAKLAQVNRRSVPGFNTLLVGGVVALLAAVVPLSDLTDATSIGTLVAFGIVNIGVVVLRYRKPDLDRSFRTPLMPWVPLIGVALCVYLVLGLDAFTWAVFGVWMLVGLVVYFAYGMPRSKLNRAAG